MRPAFIEIDAEALLHNVRQVRLLAPKTKIIAMVKADAYGCGLSMVAPILAKEVDAFGVACIEEALSIRAIGLKTPCVLFQGVFSSDELSVAAKEGFVTVIHHAIQLTWLLKTPLPTPIGVWVKVNTGMYRLGFESHVILEVLSALHNCSWVFPHIGLMTHLAVSDEPKHDLNRTQFSTFEALSSPYIYHRSMANSAAIFSLPHAHFDVVRPGIMLYGVSPFIGKTGGSLGLKPVMQFISAVSAIQICPKGASLGYGATFVASRESRIGIIAAGYGDGYPRHVSSGTPVWINGKIFPLVGRVSMDTLLVDLTDAPFVTVGTPVELWGRNLPVETIASHASTIPYELLCQITCRVRKKIESLI